MISDYAPWTDPLVSDPESDGLGGEGGWREGVERGGGLNIKIYLKEIICPFFIFIFYLTQFNYFSRSPNP